MEQSKISSFLKTLRREKNLTQEQAAEIFGVNRRTVTRWETGVSMPDLSLLVDIADYYDVDLRELFEGERKAERMDRELEKTVKQAAEYSRIEQNRASRVVLIYIVVGALALIANQVLMFLNVSGTFWAGFAKGVTGSLSLCALIMAFLYVTGRLTKVSDAKKRLLTSAKRDDTDE